MKPSTDIAAQAAQFHDAVQKFVPVCTSRYAKLLPFKDGIVELRQKGASYRLVRELLATAGLSVAVDTVGKFIREVIEQRVAARPNNRRRVVRPLSDPSTARTAPAPRKPQFPFSVAPADERDSDASAAVDTATHQSK